VRPRLDMVRRLRDSRTARRTVVVGSVLGTAALATLAGRHVASTRWPLSDARPALVVAAGLLLLLAQALKAFGWGRLFRARSARARSPSRSTT
jgi:hypothetical protein